MPEAISADVTAELLLWFYAEPRRYRAEGRRRDAPVLASSVVLKLALGRRVDFAKPELRDPEILSTLRHAAGLYVRFLFFRPEATPYQLLGLTPGATPEAIKESFRLLMHLVHPDRQDERVVWPESYAALANRAYGILRDQDSRVRFDREAQARAEMARTINRTAEAAQASRMPVPLRPQRRKRGPLEGIVLPEWLTAGVGGFAREHPSVTAFSALIVAAVVAVALMVWDTHDGALTRDLDAVNEETGGTTVARLPKLSWFSSAASAPANAPAASASARGAGVKQAPAEDAKAPATYVKPGQATIAADVASNAQSASPSEYARGPASDASPPPPASGMVATEQNDTPASSVRTVSAEPSVAASTVLMARTEPVAPPPRPTTLVEPASPPTPAVAAPAAQTIAAHSIVATSAASPAAPTSGPAPTIARVDPAATTVSSPSSPASPPATNEIESLFASFVENYERGRVDVFADLFDVDAETNLRQGRPAIRGEYDELFRLSQWRKMQLTRVNWKRVGNRAVAKGEVTVRIGWRDGREVEQRLALDMELVRRDGRVVIARLSQQLRP